MNFNNTDEQSLISYFKIKLAFIKGTFISRHLKHNCIEEIIIINIIEKYLLTKNEIINTKKQKIT